MIKLLCGIVIGTLVTHIGWFSCVEYISNLVTTISGKF